MAYITTAWGRPIQGVSQQPDRVRQEGQCTLQENATPDVVKGLTKRSAANFVAKLLDYNISEYSYFHSYDRGDEQYFMVVEPNSSVVKVFNLKGELQNMTTTHGSYLATSRPDLNLDMVTIADYTFITNKTVQVAMTSESSPAASNMGIVYCQYATYGRSYYIYLDGVGVGYNAPDGSSAEQIQWVATDYVALVLYTQIAGGTVGGTGPGAGTYPGMAGWTATLHNNTIWISKTSGANFTLSTTDGQKGEDLIAVKGSLKNTSQLPAYAPDGFVVRITGAGKSEKDDYWLKAVNSMESGIRWVETTEPGVLVAFDANTMPHTLVRDSISGGVANFIFSPGLWDKRVIGGDDGNPIPGFIVPEAPQTISSLGVLQNRLFLLSGEGIFMSRSNYFFNFWRESLQTAVDTDPLEAYADTDSVNLLHTYQVLNGDLVLFADGAQFIIDGSKPITKSNITLEQITAYQSELNVKPQAAGENVFFPYNAAGYVGVRELFTDNYSDTKKAYPITDYVNKYIPGRCHQMLASPNLNTMLIRTYGNYSTIYVYDWLWQGTDKVQSAWHKWIMDGDVHYMFYIDDILYLVYNSNGKLQLDSLYMVNDPNTENLAYSTKLDHKVTTATTYNPVTGKYSWTLPYSRADVLHTISVGGYPEDEGSLITANYLGNGMWESQDDLSPNQQLNIISGVKYRYAYVPTQPTVKDARDRVIGLDKIIMSDLFIHYEISGDIYVTVTPKSGRERGYKFTGRIMGTANNLVGSPVLDNGTYRVPIRQRAEDTRIEIWSDSHLPLTIRDMEMQGTFHQRGQRI